MSYHTTGPDRGFTHFSLHPDVLRGIRAVGFTDPRPIQASAIPAAIAGRDVLGLAQTGTGKTAAFALPIIHALRPQIGRGTQALILAPTRELATQIGAEIRALARFTRLGVVTLFGGVSAQPQRAALRLRPEIVVACPGRLLDLMDQGVLKLDRVSILVLDEADHMFDMGFLPDVRRILSALPARRQNLLFSATMPAEIRTLADRILRNPHVVELKHSTPPATIEHRLFRTDVTGKLGLLQRLLAPGTVGSAIVFTRTKHRARRLARQLSSNGRRAVALQGDMSQGQRDRAMAGFRNRSFDILVATDVAARGLDVAGVSHVVNFDVPGTPDAYLHRVGRTGRAERAGMAYTLSTGEDHDLLSAIERRLGGPIAHGAMAGMRDGEPIGAGLDVVVRHDGSRAGQAPRAGQTHGKAHHAWPRGGRRRGRGAPKVRSGHRAAPPRAGGQVRPDRAGPADTGRTSCANS